MEKAERFGIRSAVLFNCPSNMLTNHDGTARVRPRRSGDVRGTTSARVLKEFALVSDRLKAWKDFRIP